MNREPTYLGDGVYAVPEVYMDGFWLFTGSHNRAEAENKIFFEPEVFAALIRWEGNYKKKTNMTEHEMGG